LDQQKELSEFLKSKGVNNLSELPEVPEEVEELKKDIQQKEKTIIGLNNSYDKLKAKYEELKKSKGESD